MKRLKWLRPLYALAVAATCGFIAYAGVDCIYGQWIGVGCLFITLSTVLLVLSHEMLTARMHERLEQLARESQRLLFKYTDAESEAELFIRVSELIETFTTEHDVENVLRKASQTICNVFDADAALIQVYSDEESMFMLRSTHGSDEIPLPERLLDDVITRGSCKLINDLEGYSPYRELAEAGFNAVMVAPMLYSRRATGLIMVLSAKERQFTGRELRILTTFAAQASLIVENARLLKKTQDMAIRDGLTSLFNRRHFQTELDRRISLARRRNAPLSLLMLDVDDFKHYNDANGHFLGDMALRTIGSILVNNTRGADICARYGGEEFVVILPETDCRGAKKVAEKIRTAVEQASFEGEESQPGGRLTVSVGIACFPSDAKESIFLIDRADKAMYHAKRTGKNRVFSWEEVKDEEEGNRR